MSEQRSLWGSKLGFILAAVGSAVGLGNIWRFGYMAYENGGGAFLVPYTIALFVVGIPLMILEYALGHREKASPPLIYTRISKKIEGFGWWMPVAVFWGINLFYSAIISWCINYLFLSFDLQWGSDTEAFFFNDFLNYSGSPFKLGGIQVPILIGSFFTWFICWLISFKEINHGIEKASMIFMPFLFILTFVLIWWSLQLDGAWDAVKKYYLSADWSKIDITTLAGRKVWIAAFGQIFFSLSIGFGIMISYASYLPKKTDIIGNAFITCIINCVYSFFMGFAIFGTIGFMANSKGIAFSEAINGGPGLAFIVYPEAINQLPVGNAIFGVCFFLVLIVAGISSMVSLTEAFICSIRDKFPVSRKKIATITCSLGFLGSILFCTNAGLAILDIIDHFINNYMLVFSGLFECVLVGWYFKTKVFAHHVKECSDRKLWPIWGWLVQYIIPVILLLILGSAIYTDLHTAYGGYSLTAIFVYGVGMLILTFAASFLIARVKWDKSKVITEHNPDDEKWLT